MIETDFEKLLDEVRACTLCADFLPLGPRPVFQMAPGSRILIAGQAPGKKVHETGIPFNDPSGERLRDWMGVSRTEFYNPDLMAILPMGFCYPGTGKGGDLPPRPECAEAWRTRLLGELKDIRLTLVIGQYAQGWHLKGRQDRTLTDTVQNWRVFAGEDIIPLPHPSPRNIRWLKQNTWFEAEVLPVVKERVQSILRS
ncbi:uracil-DNA glycosylase family protein [Emcibacter sp.]|uniref:uracil-DNA glycosylase family protein n=1 Tax=Emcibacter sp. TaxID=1979954 RepID=UPI002AA77689|nr:uracil-DNA glycosylase family protein [Emcibacter sp.]